MPYLLHHCVISKLPVCVHHPLLVSYNCDHTYILLLLAEEDPTTFQIPSCTFFSGSPEFLPVKSGFLFCHVTCVGSMLVIVTVWSIKARHFVTVHFAVFVVVPVDARFVAVPVVSVIMSWCSHKLCIIRTCV